jgi:proteasome lid subunit RPN8/RPN11
MASVKRRLIQDAERVNPVMPVHIWRSPAGAAVDMLIVTHLSAYSCIHGHAAESLPNETGGFLVGRVAYDDRDGCWHIEIEEAIAVSPETQDPVHFTFTWRDVDRVRTYREERGKALVGWYHTHPDLGIFLSDTDLERTHRVLFSEPFQVALVYDPVRGRAGYFFWEGAQAIDASEAGWREFEIAVDEEPQAAQPALVEPERRSEKLAESAGTGETRHGDAQHSEAAAARAVTLRPSELGPETTQPPAGPTLLRTAPAHDADDIRAAPDDSSGTRSRRRAELASDDTSAGLPMPQPHRSTTAFVAPPYADLLDTQVDVLQAGSRTADTRASVPARGGWRLALEGLLVILGFAIGYLWFAAGRGLE